MSIFDFLRGLFDDVAAFFGRIPAEIRKYAAHSLELTKNIQSALQSPAAGFITSLIPGDWDEELRKKILDGIAKVLPYLTVVDACKEETDPLAMVKCWVEQLSNWPPDAQKSMLMKLAQLLTAYQHGNELKQRLYDTYVQAVYAKQKPLKEQ